MLKIQLIGNLGKDAIVNIVNDKNVINFTVAHTENYKDKSGEKQSKTLWVECSYWSERTTIVDYLKKGTQVYVDGIPDVRAYVTKDGNNAASLLVKVNSIQLLSSSNNKQDINPNDLKEPINGLPF